MILYRRLDIDVNTYHQLAVYAGKLVYGWMLNGTHQPHLSCCQRVKEYLLPRTLLIVRTEILEIDNVTERY